MKDLCKALLSTNIPLKKVNNSEKFKNDLAKNKGFEFIQQISNILIDETTVIDGLPEELSIQDFIYFKYAPMRLLTEVGRRRAQFFRLEIFVVF